MHLNYAKYLNKYVHLKDGQEEGLYEEETAGGGEETGSSAVLGTRELIETKSGRHSCRN
jgi:hypothetical protein